MPRVEFFRNDLSIRILRDVREAANLRLEYQTLSGKRWIQSTALRPIESGARIEPPAPALEDWNATTSTTGLLIKRVCLDIRDAELAALPWEMALSHLGTVVRLSRVKPVLGIEPLKLPLRIVQVGSWQQPSLARLVYGLFGRRTQADIHKAVHVRTMAELSVLQTRLTPKEPTSDVLHFVPGVLDVGDKLLSSANPEALGTLAWLSRCCFVRQARLVFIACKPKEAACFMRLGKALTDCGGPAVVVESLPPGERHKFWRGFYSDLVHDFPFDAILDRLFEQTPLGAGLVSLDKSSRSAICLFAGAGREDEMRVSSIGLRVMSIPISTRAVRSLPRLRTGLNELRKNWNTYTFEFHESDGLLPLSGAISRLRSVAGKAARVRIPPLRTAPPRFVNAGFFADRSGDPEEIQQEGARLDWGEMVHLGVDIGPQNPRIIVWGAAPLSEEVFRWTPQMKGVWVEVGITGIDFEVIGSSVREVWLPREGASERVYFPVIPRASNGISRLRICLYHKSNVVQSFRVAALTKVPRLRLDANASRKRLAASLSLSPNEVGDAGFMSQLEYSTSSVADLALRGRAPSDACVSIVANDWDSDTVVTVKAPGMQGVRVLIDSDIPDDVQNLRDLLLATSTRKFSDNTVGYAFGTEGEPNGGTPEQLQEKLTQLADLGWQLFDKLFLQDDRTTLLQVLADNDKHPIHIAHVLRDKVIPWALLYDRRFDANATDTQGKRAGPGFCPASLPNADGNLPVKECFGKGCLLEGHPETSHKDSEGRTLLPESVICPLHFWGFRYSIEIPPQQVAPGTTGARMCERISVTGKAKVAVGVNCKLSLYDAHIKELAETKTKTPADWHNPGEYDRGKILKMLEDTELAAIYFYCHAGGSAKDGARLVFQGPREADPTEEIKPADLTGGKWLLRPIVFLNGCNTAGYSPRALSRFFQKLVDDRAAAGVIGTEITVREQLACEMAQRFFLSFLDGIPAGSALLKARRALLAKNNPLGLAYTLYASAGLSLEIAD